MKKLLENKMIRLRATEPEDLEVLYSWENDTEMWKNGVSIAPFSRFTIRQYLIDSKKDLFIDRQLRLMIEVKETGETIGTIDLYDFDPFHRRAGVGILIDKRFRKKGYGLQSLMLLEAYAFGFLNLKQLYAFIPANNPVSIQLFTKAGYIPAGTLKEWLSSGDSFDDVQVMQKIGPE
ncbi:MAG: GNAT family N-acetyltransferase [Proteiniphilum sp.]|nr:GNAT family N-acetyltransferase [Proteiniphilum sp.]